jgi:hypothetical protein
VVLNELRRSGKPDSFDSMPMSAAEQSEIKNWRKNQIDRQIGRSKNQAPVSRGPISYGARRTSGRAAMMVYIAHVDPSCQMVDRRTAFCELSNGQAH